MSHIQFLATVNLHDPSDHHSDEALKCHTLSGMAYRFTDISALFEISVIGIGKSWDR